MTFTIFDKAGKMLGTLTNGPLLNTGDADLEEKVQQWIREGVPGERETHREDGFIVMAALTIRLDDPAFLLSLVRHVGRQGYVVREEHPKRDAELRQFIESLPASEAGDEVLRDFQNLTPLEKSVLVETLRAE